MRQKMALNEVIQRDHGASTLPVVSFSSVGVCWGARESILGFCRVKQPLNIHPYEQVCKGLYECNISLSHSTEPTGCTQ